MERYEDLGFEFYKYCNKRLANTNEYNIARALISHIDDIKMISLEQIASEANISIASVSRFVNKIGYLSFQDFKDGMDYFIHNLNTGRTVSNTKRFMRSTNEDMAETLYVEAISNLRQTKLNLDINKLYDIVKVMLKASSVIFIGDSHELVDFYTVQLDLIAHKIPTYSFENYNLQLLHSEFIEAGSVLVFLNIFDKFISDTQLQILQQAKAKGIKIIMFCQDDIKELEDICDIVYRYGIELSYNDGYFSLFYLSKVIAELIYKVDD